MAKERVRHKAKKRFPGTHRYVFLSIWAKDLDPEEVTRILGIDPDDSWCRGTVKGKDRKVIKRKDGRPHRRPFGHWVLESHVHGNSSLETRMRDILERIVPKKTALRQILKKAKGDLIVVVSPHKDLYTAIYEFPAHLIKEFGAIGINLEFRVDDPHNWAKFWQDVEKKERRKRIPK